MRERGLPPAFLSGCSRSRAERSTPASTCRACGRPRSGPGCASSKRTRVIGLADGPRVAVRTEGGKVSADHAVLGNECLHAGAGATRADRDSDSRLAVRDRSLGTGAARTAGMAGAGAGQHGARGRGDLPDQRSRYARRWSQGRPLPMAEQARGGARPVRLPGDSRGRFGSACPSCVKWEWRASGAAGPPSPPTSIRCSGSRGGTATSSTVWATRVTDCPREL